MTNYRRDLRGAASVFHEENRDAMKPVKAWRSNQIVHALCGLTLVGGDSGRLVQQGEFIAHLTLKTQDRLVS